MKTAIFADVHANREALDACLVHADMQGVDRIVFLGDMVGYGADPVAVLDTVIRRAEGGDAAAILGNHDEAVLSGPGKKMHADARRVSEWTRERLDPSHLNFLAGLPMKAEGTDRLYVHANAGVPGGWEYITGVFDAQRSFLMAPQRVIFFGHVHEPALYHQSPTGWVDFFNPTPGVEIPLGSRRRWLINPGSVGQPRDGIPASSYAIHDDKKSIVTFFRVPFDIDSSIRKIRNAGLPSSLGERLVKGH